MSAPLFTPERITSDITTNIAKVHTESTATVTRRVVTISRYLNGFLIAMYLSTVINTRWVKVANLCHIKDKVLNYSFQIARKCPLFQYSRHFCRYSYRLSHQPCHKIHPGKGMPEGLSLYFANVSLLRQQISPEHSTAQLVKLRWNWCWL